MSGLAANRRPLIMAPRSPKIIYLGFYRGGRGARYIYKGLLQKKVVRSSKVMTRTAAATTGKATPLCFYNPLVT